MSNILSQLGGGLADLAGLAGRGFWGAATLGATEVGRMNKRDEEEKIRQHLAQIGDVMGGEQIPQFLRPGQTSESYTPQQFETAKTQQLYHLGTPEASSFLAARQKQFEPQSPAGKIQADVAAGRLTPEMGAKLLEKESTHAGPLVKVDTGTTEGSFSKARGESINKFVDTVRNTSDMAVNALPALDQIENILNKGIVIGGADDTKIALGGVVRALGGDPTKIEKLKDVNDLETVNGLTQNLVIPLAKQLGYNPTDTDAKRIQASTAGLGKGEAANRALIGFVRDAARNSLAVQDYIDQTLTTNDPKEISVLDVRVNQLKKKLFQESIKKLSEVKPTEKVVTSSEPLTNASPEIKAQSDRRGLPMGKEGDIISNGKQRFIARGGTWQPL